MKDYVKISSVAFYEQAVHEPGTGSMTEKDNATHTQHEVLVHEEIAMHQTSRVQLITLKYVWTLLVSCIIWAVAVFAAGMPAAGAFWGSLLLAAVGVVALGLEWLFGFPDIHHSFPRTLYICNNVLFVREPYGMVSSAARYVRCRVGFIADTLDIFSIPNQLAVILDVPSGNRRRLIVCGMTDDARKSWIAALEASHAVRIERPRFVVRQLFTIVASVVMCIAVMAFWLGPAIGAVFCGLLIGVLLIEDIMRPSQSTAIRFANRTVCCVGLAFCAWSAAKLFGFGLLSSALIGMLTASLCAYFSLSFGRREGVPDQRL